MTRTGLAMALLVPIAIAACGRQEAPELPPAPVLSSGESACAARAAQVAGVDPTTVSVSPTSSTKTGATIYTATAGGNSYTCVVELDSTISSFEMS